MTFNSPLEQDQVVADVAAEPWPTGWPNERVLPNPWPTERALPRVSVGAIARRAAALLERLIAIPIAFPLAIGLLSRAYSSGLLLLTRLYETDHAPLLTAYRSPFLAWDSQWFLSIVRTGYHAGALQPGGIGGHHDFAFYPGWPAVIRGVSELGIAIPTAAVLAANLLFVAALVVVYLVMKDHFGIDSARRGATLLAFSPVAYIFSMAYSEPLFLLLAGLYFLGRNRPLSPLLVGAATITRVTGLAISASAAVVWLRNWRDWRALAAALTGPIVFLAWWLFIWQLTGDPTGWFQGSASWQPLLGIPAIIDVFYHWYTNWLVDLAFVAVMLGGAIALMRKNVELGVYSVAAIGMSVLGAPVDSMMRHATIAFPVFAYLAGRLGHRKTMVAIVGLGLLQIWYVVLTSVGSPPLAP